MAVAKLRSALAVVAVMRRIGWVLRAVAAVVLVLAAFGAVRASARAITVRLVFRSAGTADQISTTTRYSFVEKSVGQSLGGTLGDDTTGSRLTVARSGCTYTAGPLSGSPWLLFDCRATPGASSPPAPELYSLSTGSWHGVTPSPSIANPCGQYPPPDNCDDHSDAIAAGGDWIDYAITNCPDLHCGGYSEFQNLTTGEVRRGDPTGGRTILDLNSPTLSQQLCSPLRVPRYYNVEVGYGPGTVVLDGKFAIALGTDNGGIPTVYLERCGSHLHQLLTKGLYPFDAPTWAANRTSVLWQSGKKELTGVFLPSLRRFKIRLPTAALNSECQAPDFRTCFRQIALTARHLYLLDPDGALWTSSSPREPKSTKKRTTTR